MQPCANRSVVFLAALGIALSGAGASAQVCPGDKFLGNIWAASQLPDFTLYWNQVTPENAGKWGEVAPQPTTRNWGPLDSAYALAKSNGFPFRFHVLVWGSQQPVWMAALPAPLQRMEIERWFSEVAARYPGIDYLEVVNEPLDSTPSYKEALGGDGATGWDWVITAFRLARQHFPKARLMLNQYGVTSTTSKMLRYMEIIQLLQAESLIDGVGVQGHAFSTRVPASTTTANLDLLATTGLPIQVTEFDVDGPSDEVQLADYQRIFPAFWEHPAVEGITLWGWRIGMWRTAQGAYLIRSDGTRRPALDWLMSYVRSAPAPSIDSLTASHPVLWPPNHEMVAITIRAEVTDACDPAPATRIVSVTSTEPETGLDADDVGPDWRITGDLTVEPRAERGSNGPGRLYTITVESRNRFGIATTGTVTVSVPHNQ